MCGFCDCLGREVAEDERAGQRRLQAAAWVDRVVGCPFEALSRPMPPGDAKHEVDLVRELTLHFRTTDTHVQRIKNGRW